MVLLSCHCRNVVISVNELPQPFTPAEYANRSNLLPTVDAGDEAFGFVGSNETMAPAKLALGGVKTVYPELVIGRNIGNCTLFKCAICSVFTHSTDPNQQEDRSVLINTGLEKDPMKLRQSGNYSPVFEVIIDEQKFASSAPKVVNVNNQKNDVIRNMIHEIQNRSFESCQRKQREKEEKIREFQQQCNREFEEFQRRVNRERDSLLRCVAAIVMPDSQAQQVSQTERTKLSSQQLRHSLMSGNLESEGRNGASDLDAPVSRWPVNLPLDRRQIQDQEPVYNQSDLDDMEMVYGNEEDEEGKLLAGPAFDASDDSNSSNESATGRSSRRRTRGAVEIAQSAPMKVPAFQHRKSSDCEDDLEENNRPFDFRRMTLEAASLSRFTNKSIITDGTQLFGSFPDPTSNPLL